MRILPMPPCSMRERGPLPAGGSIGEDCRLSFASRGEGGTEKIGGPFYDIVALRGWRRSLECSSRSFASLRMTRKAASHSKIRFGILRYETQVVTLLRSLLCGDSGFDFAPFYPVGAVVFDFDYDHRTAAID